MKGPQVAALIWLANLLVLAGGALAGYKFWSDIEEDRTVTYSRVAEPKTKEKRITWQDTVDSATTADHTYYRDVMVSPKVRPDRVAISPIGSALTKTTTLTASGGIGNPASYDWTLTGTIPAGVSLSAKAGKSTNLQFSKATPQGSTVTVRASLGTTGDFAEALYTLNFAENAVVVPSDEELKKQLEDWVNQQFDLVRLWYGAPEVAKATVLSKEAGGATLIFRAGLKFTDEYSKEKAMDPKVQKLSAYDLTIVSIEYDHVVINGPSRNPTYKDKYFDVKLLPNKKAFVLPDINKLGKSGKIGESKIKLPDTPPPDPTVEVEDTRPKESQYDSKTDTWTLGTDDYKNINVDDLAKYAKVVHDRNGNPLGIQISDDIPDDNTVIARGGRKGDIIKAINGKPVTSMSDVRRIVREDYNAGVEEFTVTYERDGVPGTKIFKAPKKKK
jgi:hypothetical protein